MELLEIEGVTDAWKDGVRTILLGRPTRSPIRPTGPRTTTTDARGASSLLMSPASEVEPAHAAPVAATGTPTNNVPVTATIEQVIANGSRPAGCFLNAPHVHYGFSRLVISKVIGGTPRAPGPAPRLERTPPSSSTDAIITSASNPN
jgi:hypothetical protein